jgi:hypothetical protein
MNIPKPKIHSIQIDDCLRIVGKGDGRVFGIKSLGRGVVFNVTEDSLTLMAVKHCEELYRKRKTKNIMLLKYQCDVLTLVNEV